ncbi:hypothetical protein E2C01_031441 [Portunus trituberculatus]|uniref:Uncharacterized protein n=1 Tax=Portunus trituberculatus TaxID=210409 RepID=A0A5B7EXM3_PORTR|nr:hypothetical protein [Portunus trituberculatus]
MTWLHLGAPPLSRRTILATITHHNCHRRHYSSHLSPKRTLAAARTRTPGVFCLALQEAGTRAATTLPPLAFLPLARGSPSKRRAQLVVLSYQGEESRGGCFRVKGRGRKEEEEKAEWREHTPLNIASRISQVNVLQSRFDTDRFKVHLTWRQEKGEDTLCFLPYISQSSRTICAIETFAIIITYTYLRCETLNSQVY